MFNGDIGPILSIDRDLQEVFVVYEDRRVNHDFSEPEEIVLAYTVSVQQAQGCEFPAVEMPVMTQHYYHCSDTLDLVRG